MQGHLTVKKVATVCRCFLSARPRRLSPRWCANGHGVFNYIALLTCGLVLLYTMMESLGTGYIITAAECDLQLTADEKGMINAAAFLGIVTTAIFWGYLSDRYGRRAVMLPAITAGTVVSFASSLSGSFWVMFVLRFLTGCLVSASSATVYAYLGEMHTDSRRSSAIAFGSSFIAFTFIVLPVLAWAILPGSWSFTLGSVQMVPWRVFVCSWCTPGLLAAAMMLFMPESPRYLFAAKGQMKALPVLARIYAWNHGKKKEDYPVKDIRLVSAAIAQRGFSKAFANFRQLLRPPLRRCVLISHLSMFLIFLLSSGLYTWMPFILNEMLNSGVGRSVGMCAIMADKSQTGVRPGGDQACKPKTINSKVFPVSMAMGALCATTYIGIGFIMRTRNKICIYCIVLVACSFMLTASCLVPQTAVGIGLFIVGLSCGCAASVLAAIAVEVFPTSVRALALCTLYMSGRSGAAVGANLVGLGMRTQCVLVFCIITLVTAGSTLLILMWPNPKEVRTVMEGRGFAY